MPLKTSRKARSNNICWKASENSQGDEELPGQDPKKKEIQIVEANTPNYFYLGDVDLEELAEKLSSIVMLSWGRRGRETGESKTILHIDCNPAFRHLVD